MTALPKKWQAELAAQKRIRDRIAQVQRQHQKLLKERVRVLQVGGLGWTRALANTNMDIDRAWEQLRALLLSLYSRKPVV